MAANVTSIMVSRFTLKSRFADDDYAGQRWIGPATKPGNSFETGNWRVPPAVFRTPSGVVLRIEAEQDQRFIQVQDRMSRLDAAPSLVMQM